MSSGTEIREAVRLLSTARYPADVFPDDPDQARKRYRQLAGLLHPDRNPATEDVFAKLTTLWNEYQNPAPSVIHGDIADLFPVPEGLLKITRQPADNDLMAREAEALTRLHFSDLEKYQAFFPELISAGRQRDPATGNIRHVNTLRRLEGFFTLEEVQRAYPAGLEPRDIAWIWRRVLTALGAAHSAGIIHGAVLLPHIMIHPADHGLVLVDWCYSSSQKNMRIPAVVRKYKYCYAPEILNKEVPSPAADIYMAAKVMAALLGDPGKPGYYQLLAFAKGCMHQRPTWRPQQAWRLLKELDELLERIFGPPRFHPFAMPANVSN